jgi:type VI secretion system protein VasG
MLLLALTLNLQLLAQLDAADELDAISAERLRSSLEDILAGSAEPVPGIVKIDTGDAAAGGIAEGSALSLYAQDLTARAREGNIDPIFCRDREIRQMLDILGRRRKNNPLAVGEAGVGKTALVEGLAIRIASGDVPENMKDVSLLALDLQAMQAGASVRGEFEKRLKSVIEEVKSSERPVVLFIDEVHTLIGAGGAAGTGDAANILKPALARGELRTIAATTWAEYKKYIEKDAALARRFHLVTLAEPSPDQAAIIMRGLRKLYEKSHGVYVRDDAVVAAAEMSARYISGRLLPDKAVDVLDTASARVKLSQSTKPASLEGLEQHLATLDRERTAIQRDIETGVSQSHTRIAELDEEIETAEADRTALEARWHEEQGLAGRMLELREQLAADEVPDETHLREELETISTQLVDLHKGDPLVAYEASPDTVAQVISDWTGIPLGKMVRDQASSVLEFNERLRDRIKGQDHAIEIIDQRLRASKAGIASPDAPIGVFLLVGPSGVGKTETALGVADLMFGGERFVTTVNMAEFMEKHSVSRLIGSPPGYVDSDKGGMLTEAVRQRPYSVVLLDEVEKAHPDVMNLFYQVFDKGELADGQSLTVNFRNTIVFLTSNMCSEEIMALWQANPEVDAESVMKEIQPVLSRYFKPALLARMNTVPFLPLPDTVLREIVDLKLDKLVRRLREAQRIRFTYDETVADQIVARCQEVETGARNIDFVVNNSLVPDISTEILARMGGETMPERLNVELGDGGAFRYTFS